MPVRYVTEDAVALYAEARGDAILHRLDRGDRVDVDGNRAPEGGRHPVRHGELWGWVDSARLTASGMGLVASVRRSGSALPESPAAHRPAPSPAVAESSPYHGSPATSGPVQPHRTSVQASDRLERRDDGSISGGWAVRTLLWTLAFAVLLQLLFSFTSLPLDRTVMIAVGLWVVMQVLVFVVPRRRSIPRRRAD